jgi:hypothetical protein
MDGTHFHSGDAGEPLASSQSAPSRFFGGESNL